MKMGGKFIGFDINFYRVPKREREGEHTPAETNSAAAGKVNSPPAAARVCGNFRDPISGAITMHAKIDSQSRGDRQTAD